MNTENISFTSVTSEDMALVIKELTLSNQPLHLSTISEKIAFAKTAPDRAQTLKKYDPNARYEVGDLIYKEYDETLNIGSKIAEHFTGAVVLRVIHKTFNKTFNCDMLEVDYSGGGVFRKYIDYMKKTKTQVLLPSNFGGNGFEPEVVPREVDPRLTELPMTEQEIKKLQKTLRAALAKNTEIFTWNDYYQLTSKKIEFSQEKISGIEKYIDEVERSVRTEELVEKVLGVPQNHELFALNSLSLNHTLEKIFKKDYILVSTDKWGKWHLKRILNSLPDGLPLNAPQVQLPELIEIEKPEMSFVPDFPIKVYLTWREILSGGLKMPKSLARELSGNREYVFTEADTGKTYTVYYYSNGSYFLGLAEFYQQNDIPQGASLTIKRTGEASFSFWVKKSKKKTVFPRLDYDSKKDIFADRGEDAVSLAEPNKIIFLERDVLAHLFNLYEKRDDLNLKDLLVIVFKDPHLATAAHSLHFLRAYHMVDLIKHTTQEDVEFTLLNSPEFVKSDKKKGVFTYEEPVRLAKEPVLPAEIQLQEAEERSDELEELPAGEASLADTASLLTEAVEPEIQPKIYPPAVPEVKKEKPKKKKKEKSEAEKALRPKKSERRVIEEKIEEEESAQEALSALKERDEQKDDQTDAEKVESIKPIKKEEPKFGFFAEMLKSALKKKDSSDDEAEEEKKK